MSWFAFRFSDFAYSFLSILFEGVPFLLLGSLISGCVDAFVPSKTLTRILPRDTKLAILVSGLMGAIFPMCECGSVVLIRRFIKKGLPVSCAVTYMLAAPIVNPVVALSTFAAFRGQNPWLMVSLRLALGFAIAVAVGFIVQQIPSVKILTARVVASIPIRRSAFRIAGDGQTDPEFDLDPPRLFSRKIFAATRAATSDFLDVAFFLIIGAAIASVFNTAVNQQWIAPLALNPSIATLSMMLLAFMLALCSTTDAFIAATFVTFPVAAKLAFLVLGPVLDVKLIFLYGLIFKRWFVLALAIGLFSAVALICVRLSMSIL